MRRLSLSSLITLILGEQLVLCSMIQKLVVSSDTKFDQELQILCWLLTEVRLGVNLRTELGAVAHKQQTC